MQDALLTIVAPVIEGETLKKFGASIEAAAAQTSDKTAVIDHTGQWTWKEFHALAAQVAGGLRAKGVGANDRVATMGENSGRHLAVYVGIIMAGAGVVPLPTGAHADTLRLMCEDCAPKLLFASDLYMDIANTLGAPEIVATDEIEDWAAPHPAQKAESAGPDDLFDLIYSSGTTGRPKGIIHDHRFRSRQLERMPQFGLNDEAVLLMSTPVYSNTTLVAVLPVLSLGGTVVTLPKFSTIGFLELAQKHKVTHAMLVPVQYMRLMDEPKFDDYDLSAFQAKLSTSAPLPGALIERVQVRWPGNLFELYGMTEGGVSCVLDCDQFPDKLDTVGKAAEGSHLVILSEDGEALPEGEYGEIAGRSGAMMPGYLNAADKTKEAHWRDAEGNDYIRTGDMGRLDAEGFLQLLDRRKDMIISGGFNIYATDLEQALRAHDDVADVAVIAIPSKDWGETPLALVVLKSGAAIEAEALRFWANEKLGKIQRISAIEFREDLPRSSIGKILKRELRVPYWPA